jgi:hypothetical protein
MRRFGLVGLTSAVVVAVGFYMATPATSGPPGQIKVLHSGKVMDLVADSAAAGTPVVQRASDSGASQTWSVVQLSTVNGWPVVLVLNTKSGQVLDVAGGLTGLGVGVVQTPWAASMSQLWVFIPYGNTGNVLMLNAKSGKYAEVNGGSTDDGASVVQWDWKGTLDEIWTTPAPEPLPTSTSTSSTTPASSSSTAVPSSSSSVPATSSTTNVIPSITTTLPITVPTTG